MVEMELQTSENHEYSVASSKNMNLWPDLGVFYLYISNSQICCATHRFFNCLGTTRQIYCVTRSKSFTQVAPHATSPVPRADGRKIEPHKQDTMCVMHSFLRHAQDANFSQDHGLLMHATLHLLRYAPLKAIFPLFFFCIFLAEQAISYLGNFHPK
jgi:hypothetical protein